MLKIDENNNILLTRGDSAELELTVKDEDNNDYDYSNDVVKFGVKRSALDKTEPMLKKTFDENGKIYFAPEDTENMEFGDYLYDVEISHTEGEGEEAVTTVTTVIAAAKFSIGWNVL